MIHGLQIQIQLGTLVSAMVSLSMDCRFNFSWGHWLVLLYYDPRIADSNSVGGHWLVLWFYDPWIADSNSVGGHWLVLWFYDPWIADSNSVGDNG